MQNIWCPRCKDHVNIPNAWGQVFCPRCGLIGLWIEDEIDMDTFMHIEWEYFDEEEDW